MLMLLLALGVASSLPGPAPLPTGMDLLYDEHVPIQPSGEPIVTVGLAMGLSDVTVRSAAPLQVDFYEAGVFKQATVPMGRPITVGLGHTQAAQRNQFVDVQGIPLPTPEALDEALHTWRQRGFGEVMPLEEGMVLGIGGRVLDNRVTRVVIPARTALEAKQLAQTINRQWAAGKAQVKQRLAERPWGELPVRAAGVPLGLAASYVRISSPSQTPIQVDNVAFGAGYAWHGSEDRTYRGDIYAVVDPNGLLAVVNAIGAEALLQGVVPAEIFSSAAPEALKAQAVAARNTLFAKLGHRHHEEPFHLCAEQHCQVYAGTAREDPRTGAAVRATNGQTLFWGGHLVDAVYSASCGGHTENNDAVWGDTPDPALRGRPDFDPRNPQLAPFADGLTDHNVGRFVTTSAQPRAYCAQATGARPEKYRWQKHFSRDQLNAILRKHGASIGALRNIVVKNRGPGGRITRLQLVGDKHALTLNRELPIRQFFGNLNSAAFVVDTTYDDDGVIEDAIFSGGGWGHGVGMCQLGAMGRAQAGQNYGQILSYYYNGATLKTLYNAPH